MRENGIKKTAMMMFVMMCISCVSYAATQYNSYKGLQMYGYQGWFNCEGDGAGRGWKHYNSDGKLQPGYCHIDFWPDVSEYTKIYKTAFKFANGQNAYLFSPYDASTVDVHFKWMKDYGQDGAFMQRFTVDLASSSTKAHYMKLFDNAVLAANKYDRALSIRYDITNCDRDDYKDLLADLDALNAKYDFFGRTGSKTFLHHNGKPLIAFGGIGWQDDGGDISDRGYLREARYIIDALQSRGYSLLVRVPAKWRTKDGQMVTSSTAQAEFFKQIKRCDIVMPWHVGAFREDSYLGSWPERIEADIDWCTTNGLEYVPVVYPGFSRYNMLKRVDDGSFRPRNKGSFFWMQVSRSLQVGAEMLFLAQFDEMDEGTQFFKCVRPAPAGSPSKFQTYESDVQNDHYLWLAGESGRMLRGEKTWTTTLPNRSGAATASCHIDIPTGNVTTNLGATLYVKATASDSDGVERVKIFLNGVEKMSDASSPYEFSLPLTNAGTFTLTAQVKDVLGNYTASDNSRTITVGGTPSVTLLNEGFEADFSGNWSSIELWKTNSVSTNRYAGSRAAWADGSANNLYGKTTLNTAPYNTITVSFWYKDNLIDADDNPSLCLYNCSTKAWVTNVFNLNLTTENVWTSKSLSYTKASYPQYFGTNFGIRFRANDIDTGENLFLDEVKVTAQ